jgi:hypothetical protein
MDVKNLRNGKQGKTELVYVLETLAKLGCPTKLFLNVYDHTIDNCMFTTDFSMYFCGFDIECWVFLSVEEYLYTMIT